MGNRKSSLAFAWYWTALAQLLGCGRGGPRVQTPSSTSYTYVVLLNIPHNCFFAKCGNGRFSVLSHRAPPPYSPPATTTTLDPSVFLRASRIRKGERKFANQKNEFAQFKRTNASIVHFHFVANPPTSLPCRMRRAPALSPGRWGCR